jgi:hypothetical protein
VTFCGAIFLDVLHRHHNTPTTSVAMWTIFADYFIYSSVAILIYMPSCNSYSFRPFMPQYIKSPASIRSTDLQIERLSESLSKAFPASSHQNPAYASVLLYLSSLESKPSCHRSVTAALINDCNLLSVSDSSHGGDLRYQYAAQLAACEFEATGVWYPLECKGLARDTKKNMRCIKKLEERPQWWTTLSNNIQNSMVICAAVRHEVEQGDLLLQEIC